MVEIEFLGPIGLKSIKVEAKNLGEVKAALSDKISILPPVCGG